MTNDNRTDPERLMTRAEAAAAFRVHPDTITRWANTGELTSIRTPGGHRRYRQDKIRKHLYAPEPAAVHPPSRRDSAAASAVLHIGSSSFGIRLTPVADARGVIILGSSSTGAPITLTAGSGEWLADLEEAIQGARAAQTVTKLPAP